MGTVHRLSALRPPRAICRRPVRSVESAALRPSWFSALDEDDSAIRSSNERPGADARRRRWTHRSRGVPVSRSLDHHPSIGTADAGNVSRRNGDIPSGRSCGQASIFAVWEDTEAPVHASSRSAQQLPETPAIATRHHRATLGTPSNARVWRRGVHWTWHRAPPPWSRRALRHDRSSGRGIGGCCPASGHVSGANPSPLRSTYVCPQGHRSSASSRSPHWHTQPTLRAGFPATSA